MAEVFFTAVMIVSVLRKPLEKRFSMFPWRRVIAIVSGVTTGIEAIRLISIGWQGIGIIFGLFAFAQLFGGYSVKKLKKQGGENNPERNGCAMTTVNIIYTTLAVSALQFVALGMLVHAFWAGAYCALVLRGKIGDLRQKS